MLSGKMCYGDYKMGVRGGTGRVDRDVRLNRRTVTSCQSWARGGVLGPRGAA